MRNPAYKFEGRSLGHETAHLVLYRFFGAAIPLWLNEGYAENSSIRFYAGLERRRGYNCTAPFGGPDGLELYSGLNPHLRLATYPDDVTQVSIFYQESEKLVAFLRAQGTEGFITFLDAHLAWQPAGYGAVEGVWQPVRQPWTRWTASLRIMRSGNTSRWRGIRGRH